MKAMILDRPGAIGSRPLRSASIAAPEPAAEEIRVRVLVCGVCRTDLHVVEGDLPAHRLPVIPGHQIVGRVDAGGPGATRFRVGDRVGIAWLRHTCGACGDCRSGAENLCGGSRYTGWDADGGFAEFAIVPQAFAYAVPEPFADADAAPLLCAGIVGYRALSRSAVPRGGRLGIYGFGSSAHIVIQIARHRGCEVYVATRGDAHRELARQLGAAWVGGSHDAPPVPLDGAIVFAPAGDVVPPALRAVRHGGAVVLAGIHSTDLPTMAYEPHLFHEKVLTSVEANTRADAEGLLAEAAAIPIRPRTTLFPLEEANEALAAVAADAVEGSAVLLLS